VHNVLSFFMTFTFYMSCNANVNAGRIIGLLFGATVSEGKMMSLSVKHEGSLKGSDLGSHKSY
jgi:hypothetical protein